MSLLTGGGGNENYWHWLFDVLPRLKIVKDKFKLEEIDFFLFPETNQRYQVESLDILKKASSYVGDSREKEYGNKLKNHDNIAKLWSAYKEIEFTARDVAVMMALLKIARIHSNPTAPPPPPDACGYMACGGEVVSK